MGNRSIMEQIKIFCLFALLYKLCIISGEEYNITLYEVTAFNARERALLYYTHIIDDNAIFLNGVTNEAAMPMDIILEGSGVENFEKKLLAHDVQYTYIPTDKVTILESENTLKAKDQSYIDTFLDFEGIENWMAHKLKKYELILERMNFTTLTYERNNIYVLRLSTGKKKPAVFILGGEEGRDWMSPIVILNFLNTLLEDQKMQIFKKYDFYFLPVLNPDGYVFSMTEDRFWTRNRKAFFPEKVCDDGRVAVGVNVERNWYLAKSAPLTTESECNSIYVGHKSLSEEETKNISMFLNQIAVNLIAFVNVKSFERLITIPYAYVKNPSNNHDLMMEILSYVTEKLQTDYNVTYYYGNTASFYYNLTGSCADWVKQRLNVPIVFTAFMKHAEVFLPLTSDIEPLTKHFVTIMNETLLLADDIYGPLFNNQVKIQCLNFTVMIPLMIVTVIYYVVPDIICKCNLNTIFK